MSLRIREHYFDERQLPLVIEADGASAEAPLEELLAWFDDNRRGLLERLYRHGAVLFRGFSALRGAAEFEAFGSRLSPRSLEYVGGTSPRRQFHGKVMNASDYPAEWEVALHQEMSYLDGYPDFILFFCLIAPKDRGQTPIADMRKVYAQMPPRLRERFEARGLTHTRIHPKVARGRLVKTWPEVFGTEDKPAVERIAQAKGWKLRWEEGDELTLEHSSPPASLVHPVTQERVWFTQAHAMHPSSTSYKLLRAGQYKEWLEATRWQRRHPGEYQLHTRYADGSLIPSAHLNQVRRLLDANKVMFNWQKGDVLFIDNILVSHGRQPFSGEREILTMVLVAEEDRRAA